MARTFTKETVLAEADRLADISVNAYQHASAAMPGAHIISMCLGALLALAWGFAEAEEPSLEIRAVITGHPEKHDEQ